MSLIVAHLESGQIQDSLATFFYGGGGGGTPRPIGNDGRTGLIGGRCNETGGAAFEITLFCTFDLFWS